jgi:hypothetical protein
MKTVNRTLENAAKLKCLGMTARTKNWFMEN